MELTIDQTLHPRIQLLAGFGSLFLLLLVIWLIRKERLKEGYSIVWFVTGFVMLIFSLFSNLLFRFSSLAGIYYAPAALFSILLLGNLLVSIHFSTILSRHEKRIKELAQEVGLLKDLIEKKSGKGKTKNAN